MAKRKDKRHIDSKRVILSILGFMIIAILLGSFLFHRFEGRDYFHSLYFTVITFSTIGYGDVTPITHIGKIIAMIYALLGVPLFVGITSVVMELRFKKFVFHHFEHHSKALRKTDSELKKELTEEEMKNLKQEKEIKKIEKEMKEKNQPMIKKIMKKFKK
ncbi:MAG TPA: potassium channel family protein [Candidatus Absconditabacterales bacterium]|nr:potassium channel family protein [Candidatus Absconditabacterales bacterium]